MGRKKKTVDKIILPYETSQNFKLIKYFKKMFSIYFSDYYTKFYKTFNY